MCPQINEVCLDASDSRAQVLEGKLDDLRERLIFLAETLAPSRGKYEYLEQRTGISAARWQNLFLRRLMPSTEMILAIAEYRRDKMEWLVTGHVKQEFPQKPPAEELWSEFMLQQEFVKRKRSPKPSPVKKA